MKLTNTIINTIELLKKRQHKITLVFPEGWNKMIIDTAKYLIGHKLCKLVLLVRDKKEIDEHLKQSKDTSYIVVNSQVDSIMKKELINLLVSLRKHKGMTIKKAKELLAKTNYYGTMLVKANLVDAYVGGIEYSTRDTIKPALQIIKTKHDVKIAGDFFLMEKGKVRYIFTNCAVNLNPTAEQLVDLAHSSIVFAKKIGIKNLKVAFLSYSTANSGIGESANKVRRAVALFNQDKRFKGLEVKCELQFDAAFSQNIRLKKAPQVSWENSANIYIFPNLDAGNIGYKITQRLANFNAIGPILSGLAKPMNDLSRGSTLEDIISTSIITAISVEGD